MSTLGAKLEALLKNAHCNIILVAPFVKVATLEHLFKYTNDGVEIQCVTRWRPDEIAVGVSDLGIWPLLKQYPKASLWLRPDLHAKYYRADDQCLIGSANLTATALGWSSRPNLEILVSIPVNDPQIAWFEADLLAGCIQVDDNLFEQMSRAVELLMEQEINILQRPNFHFDTIGEEIKESISTERWLPTLRHPEKLFEAYSGNLENLSTTTKMLALSDLRALAIPPGLSKVVFDTYVGILLLQMPIIKRVDEFVATPQRFGSVRDLLVSLPCADTSYFNASEAWQTLMRWLRYFLTDRYELTVPRHSEVFFRT